MATPSELQIGNTESLEKTLHRIFVEKRIKENSFLDTLISQKRTIHCGGMADPFQPCENTYHITKQFVDLSNQYRLPVLFSTKSDNLYQANIRPDLHTFQFSVTNTENRLDIEPNVPDFENRYKLYKELKKDGFKVGIRIQPFIPDVTTTDIIKMFRDTDQFTIEGLKLVPQNLEQRAFLLEMFHLKASDFKQSGLLNLKPEIRLRLYQPFLELLTNYNIPYSVADNDLRHLSTNRCCCGDALVTNPCNFNTTALIHNFGMSYNLNQALSKIKQDGLTDCSCKGIFASNRQIGVQTVSDCVKNNFEKRTSPCSPKFQYSL